MGSRWNYQNLWAKTHYLVRGASKAGCGRPMLGSGTSDHMGKVQRRNTTRDWDLVTCKACLRCKPKTVWERLDA